MLFFLSSLWFLLTEIEELPLSHVYYSTTLTFTSFRVWILMRKKENEGLLQNYFSVIIFSLRATFSEIKPFIANICCPVLNELHELVNHRIFDLSHNYSVIAVQKSQTCSQMLLFLDLDVFSRKNSTVLL